jgi:hypothetical protein
MRALPDNVSNWQKVAYPWRQLSFAKQDFEKYGGTYYPRDSGEKIVR